MERESVTLPEFIYTVVLRPKPLRLLADAAICSAIPARKRIHGATVVLNPRDPVVSGALMLGVYEKPETAFFLEACHQGMTFLDIGANLGYYTALAIPRLGSGRIIALEPDPENFEYLQRTVAANGNSNTICVAKGAAAENGSMTLFSSGSNRGDNRLYANEFPGTRTEVAVVTIDSLLVGLQVPQVNLIKIDVQGFEGHVLRGMEKTLRQPQRLVILMEFWPFGLRSAGSSPEEVLQRLEMAGLELFELTSKGTLIPLANKHDIIARHPGRRYTNIVAYRGEGPPPRLDSQAQ
jgi:FkbM family methyltransferase